MALCCSAHTCVAQLEAGGSPCLPAPCPCLHKWASKGAGVQGRAATTRTPSTLPSTQTSAPPPRAVQVAFTPRNSPTYALYLVLAGIVAGYASIAHNLRYVAMGE